MKTIGQIMRSGSILPFLCAIASLLGCAKSPSEAKSPSGAMAPEVAVVSDGKPTTAEAIPSAASFLQPLGVRPLLGRDFIVEDMRRETPKVAVISSELWATAFASRPDVVGRHIQVAAREFVVIGVAPSGPFPLAGRKVWFARQN